MIYPVVRSRKTCAGHWSAVEKRVLDTSTIINIDIIVNILSKHSVVVLWNLCWCLFRHSGFWTWFWSFFLEVVLGFLLEFVRQHEH